MRNPLHHVAPDKRLGLFFLRDSGLIHHHHRFIHQLRLMGIRIAFDIDLHVTPFDDGHFQNAVNEGFRLLEFLQFDFGFGQGTKRFVIIRRLGHHLGKKLFGFLIFPLTVSLLAGLKKIGLRRQCNSGNGDHQTYHQHNPYWENISHVFLSSENIVQYAVFKCEMRP